MTCKVQPHIHWPPKQLLCHHLLRTYLLLPAPTNLTAHCPHWAATGSQSIFTSAHLLVVAALLPHAKAAHLCWLAHQLLCPHPHFDAAAGWRNGCCGALWVLLEHSSLILAGAPSQYPARRPGCVAGALQRQPQHLQERSSAVIRVWPSNPRCGRLGSKHWHLLDCCTWVQTVYIQ